MEIRVYLADESHYFREGLRVVLEVKDIRVAGDAGDGRQALMDCAVLRPDVVVMDFAIPHRDGLALVELLHASSPAPRVIVLSTRATTMHVLHALQSGAHGYLLKSNAPAEIVEAVRTVHSGRRFVSHKLAETLAEEYLRHAAAGTASHAEMRDAPAPASTALHLAASDDVETRREELIRTIREADAHTLKKLAAMQDLVLH